MKFEWVCKNCGFEGKPLRPYFDVCPKCLMNKMVVKEEKQKVEFIDSMNLLSFIAKSIFVDIVDEAGAGEQVPVHYVSDRFHSKLEQRIEAMREKK